MPTRRIVVDRIEGDIAVLEVNGQAVHLPVSALPEGAGEGSVLRLTLAASTTRDAAARLARMQSSSDISDDFTL